MFNMELYVTTLPFLIKKNKKKIHYKSVERFYKRHNKITTQLHYMAKLHGGDGHFSNCQMICNACIHVHVRGRRGMWTYHRIDKPFKGISGRHKVIDFTSCSCNRTFRESFVHLPWLCHEKFVGYRSAGMCIHRLMGLSDFIFYWGGGGRWGRHFCQNPKSLPPKRKNKSSLETVHFTSNFSTILRPTVCPVYSFGNFLEG